MSLTQEDRREFERQLELKRKNAPPKPPGAVGKFAFGLRDWFKAAGHTLAAYAAWVWSWLDPIASRLIRLARWMAPKLGWFSWRTAILISCKKDEAGKRHFNWRYMTMNLVKIGLTGVIIVALATPAYYYGTWDTHRDIYIPNAGVFVNQQFVHPSGAGQIIAPRDEVFTVLGKEVTADGKVEPVRFDIDFNLLFFFYADALRPDLAAAKLDSQSPYGVKCTVETTGLYNRLPRFVRLWALKWWDLRPEIVRVVSCEELTSLPPFFESDKPAAPPVRAAGSTVKPLSEVRPQTGAAR